MGGNYTISPDVAIIGAGHNGLVTAAYLARAGLSVTLFERRAIVGGAAVTEEFAPGFRNSTASYAVSLLHPKIIRELNLAAHGLRIVARPMQNFLPLPNGDSLSAPSSLAALTVEVARHSRRDAERLPQWYAFIGEAAQVLRELSLQTPPTDFTRWPDVRRFRSLSQALQRSLYELFTRSAGEILDFWFESEALKALYGFDAIVGSYASPYTPGSGYVLLHHAFGEVNGQRGVWGHAIGGMGAITQAMADEAQRCGAQIETEQSVKRVLVESGRAVGIELTRGRVVHVRVIAANINPKLLYLHLIDPAQLPRDFVDSMQRHRCASRHVSRQCRAVGAAALHRGACWGQRSVSLRHHHCALTRLYGPRLAQARLCGHSRAPIIELLIPSTLDDSLAPPGAHVASLFCQHFAPQLPNGRDWESARDQMTELLIETVNQYAPNFGRAVIARSALSPADLEQRFGLIGGDIFHGALGLEQLWAARAVLGYGDYGSPLRGLYLCGAGAHRWWRRHRIAGSQRCTAHTQRLAHVHATFILNSLSSRERWGVSGSADKRIARLLLQSLVKFAQVVAPQNRPAAETFGAMRFYPVQDKGDENEQDNRCEAGSCRCVRCARRLHRPEAADGRG